MNKKQILVVSNPGMMNDSLLQWINTSKAFDMTFAETHEKAIELANRQFFDMVLIDEADMEIHAGKLKAVLPIFNTEILLLAYKGENPFQLEQKVKHAFNERKAKRVKRLLVLDPETAGSFNTMPPFSLN